MTMRIDIVTAFPEYFQVLGVSLLGKAQRAGILDVHTHDLRHFTHDRHQTVDDTPYGGGPGMLMRPEPWGDALDHVVSAGPVRGSAQPLLVVPTPAGRPFTQELAREWSSRPWLVFACGRYEGLDQRVIDDARSGQPVQEVSLGDYVLNGGEVAALAMIESVGRLLPGVIGNQDSLTDESHNEGLLEAPGYTKPPSWRGLQVPAILTSGNHAAIKRWRRDESIRRTSATRPDLVEALDPARLDLHDLTILSECGWVSRNGRFSQAPPPVAD